MAAFYTFAKTIIDKALLWIHGRRLGIFGDGQGATNSSLVLDGVVVGSTRTGAAPLVGIAAGSNGAGAITVAGTLVGDTVTIAVNLSTPGDSSSSFETTVTVAGQIQQSSASNLSGSTFLFLVNPQAAV